MSEERKPYDVLKLAIEKLQTKEHLTDMEKEDALRTLELLAGMEWTEKSFELHAGDMMVSGLVLASFIIAILKRNAELEAEVKELKNFLRIAYNELKPTTQIFEYVTYIRSEHHPSCDGTCKEGLCPVAVPEEVLEPAGERPVEFEEWIEALKAAEERPKE